jgi:thermitase
MPKNKYLKQIYLYIFLLLFALGQFSLAPNETSAKPKVEKMGSNLEKYEAVVKISCSDCQNNLASKYNISLSPLGGEGNENFYLARSLSKKSAKTLVRALEKDPNIEMSQPNFKYKPLARTASDAYFPEEWWLFDSSQSTGGVSASSAWDLELKKQRVVAVAVIDSGANYKHKDLKKNLTKGKAKGKNFERPKKKPTDDDGHGSFIAGIIAAQTNNRRGISGASFYSNLKVMPLRFDFTTSQAIQALAYAKAKNVPVVNASWGSYGEEGYDSALEDAISQYGGVFVTASGNNGYNHDSSNPNHKMYPCDFNLENIICVGATDQNGNLADYSDYGMDSIDVAAPGGSDGYPIIGLADSKSRYTEAEGSSLSTAFVSAEAGLLFSKYRNLSGAQVIGIIKNSVDISSSLAGKVLSGGKVNFQKALQNAASY